MSSKTPYISQEYKHLQFNSQSQPVSHFPQNQPCHFQVQQPSQFPHQYPQQQYFIQQQKIHQQPIVFLPSTPQNQIYPQQRASDDSYAADEPNFNYPSINSYEKPSYNNYQQADYHQQQPICSTNTPQKDENQVLHKVQYGDTLEGLSLIYDTPISKIKQRNNIEGDSIYYLKELIIPNPNASPLQSAKTQDMLIEQFMGYMPADERSDKTARFYLNDNDWLIEDAVKAFKADLEWERSNRVKISTLPVNKYGKADYQEMQLLIKKAA